MDNKEIPVAYSANNSGGRDWLSEKDWKNLEKAGWKIFGFGEFAYKNGQRITDKNGLPARYSEVPESEQDKKDRSYFNVDEYQSAYKLFNSIQEAIKEFEEITGQDVTEEGCNCCGAPHSFTWGKDTIVRVDTKEKDYNCESGEDLLKYLYPNIDITVSKRELIEKLNLIK